MVETALAESLRLTPRLERQVGLLLRDHQQEPAWHGRLPVLLLERCWLQLRVVPVERLATLLPPDCTAAAPELERFRQGLRAGLSPAAAEAHCWREFGEQACRQALLRHWRAQERGDAGWTLEAYLHLVTHYRQAFAAPGHRPLPLLELAPGGRGEQHRLRWLVAPGTPDAAHLPPD